ncbi:MAG TPA: hypothetical protein VFQ48_10805, partial [Pseudonocardiaceae bacterium]|nr:hypothetical protein [Pseudonocardiaceae bacterium]
RGLPHRLGRLGSAVAGCGAALAAIAVILIGQGGPPALLDRVVAGGAVTLSAGALLILRGNPRSEAAFYSSMVIAALGIILIARSGALP